MSPSHAHQPESRNFPIFFKPIHRRKWFWCEKMLKSIQRTCTAIEIIWKRCFRATKIFRDQSQLLGHGSLRSGTSTINYFITSIIIPLDGSNPSTTTGDCTAGGPTAGALGPTASALGPTGAGNTIFNRGTTVLWWWFHHHIFDDQLLTKAFVLPMELHQAFSWRELGY